MAINKLPEFAKDGQKNTDDLVLTDGFPVLKKPARQWFNWLFNTVSLKINEIIDNKIDFENIVDNLTTNDANKPVSAKQAKVLQDNKLEKTANAVSATKLQEPRKINNVDFDGTSDITVTDDALTYMPIPYPKSSPPTGYLAMMGQAISKSTYPKLYALYGAVLPDMRAYSVRGLDYGRGIDVGRSVLSQQEDAIQNIKGSLKAGSQYDRNTQFIDALVADGAFSVLAGDKSYTGDASGWGQAWGTEFDASRVVRTSTETRMKNVAFLYIVKAG